MPRLQRKAQRSKLTTSDLSIRELVALVNGRANENGKRDVRWRGEAELREVWLAVRDDALAGRVLNGPVESWPIYQRFG